MDVVGVGALNSTATIVLSGELCKSGKRLGMTTKRWYVLTANGILHCYEDKTAKKFKSNIVMTACHVALRSAEGKEPLKLVITFTGDTGDSDSWILWSQQTFPDTRKWFESLKTYDASNSHQLTSVHAKDPIVSNSPGAAVVKSSSAPTSPNNPNSAQAIQRAVQLYNTPVKSNKHSKYLTALGMSSSSPLAWIAEHIARPPLPPDWEKLKDEKRRTYYANAALLQSSWEHPLLFYYPWLCRIFSKMLPVDSSTNLPIAPEEIIDFLINNSNLLIELNLESEFLPMHDLKSLQRRVSCDPVFYYTWLFSPKQGQTRHPYLKLSDERGWDPELVRSVAEYYGIDLAAEPHLIWLPKLALVAPLPPFWTSSEDEQGDTLFYCIVSSYGTQGHPVDRYVTLLLQQSRLTMNLENHCAAVRAGWFDVINADGIRTWYNMVAAESSALAPSGWDDAHERRLQASWNLDMEVLIMSLCHIRAEQGLQPEWQLPPSVNSTLSRTEAAEAHAGTSGHAAVSTVDVSFALEDNLPEAYDDESNPQNHNAVFSPGDEVPGDGSISGSEDDCEDTEDKVLLLQHSENEVRGDFDLPQFPESFDRSMQTSPVDFRAPEVESTSYFVDGFSMSGAVRSGSRAVQNVGVQYIWRPDCKDVACYASFTLETNLAGTNAGIAVQDADIVQLDPVNRQFQDVIAHQHKVKKCHFFHHIPFSSDESKQSLVLRLLKISSDNWNSL
jgi:hypothetical protein